MDKGLLIVVSAPSGCGKGTLLEAAGKRHDFALSVSTTTRAPRPGEQEGVSYYFKTREQFEELIAADGLLEHAEYVGNYYGTPREPVERHLNEGRDVILEIEVQGAMQVKKRCPEAVLVFILPPSVETLRHRLQKRGTESAEVIEQRVKAAETELEMARYYDYTVVNDDLDKAVDDFLGVIEAAREKVRGRK